MPPPQSANAVIEACRLLSEEQPIATRELARAVGLSDSYFQRCFKKHLGITPQQYRRRILAERGRDVLGAARSVTESIYIAGYSTSSRFYEGIGRELGMKPSTARTGGTGEQIEYVVAECSLGQLLIAWTPRGVCEVAFGDSETAILNRLRSHFPNAKLGRAEPGNWAQAVIESVEIATPADIPLDIRGTAFQERVWQELRRIPVGQTRSYSELAEALGEPGAARAVARACASNKLAVAIPCHRAVRKDGGLSGYRWGVERKRELLRREATVGESPNRGPNSDR